MGWSAGDSLQGGVERGFVFIAPKLAGEFLEPLVLGLGVKGRGFAGWHSINVPDYGVCANDFVAPKRSPSFSSIASKKIIGVELPSVEAS